MAGPMNPDMSCLAGFDRIQIVPAHMAADGLMRHGRRRSFWKPQVTGLFKQDQMQHINLCNFLMSVTDSVFFFGVWKHLSGKLWGDLDAVCHNPCEEKTPPLRTRFDHTDSTLLQSKLSRTPSVNRRSVLNLPESQTIWCFWQLIILFSMFSMAQKPA